MADVQVVFDSIEVVIRRPIFGVRTLMSTTQQRKYVCSQRKPALCCSFPGTLAPDRVEEELVLITLLRLSRSIIGKINYSCSKRVHNRGFHCSCTMGVTACTIAIFSRRCWRGQPQAFAIYRNRQAAIYKKQTAVIVRLLPGMKLRRRKPWRLSDCRRQAGLAFVKVRWNAIPVFPFIPVYRPISVCHCNDGCLVRNIAYCVYGSTVHCLLRNTIISPGIWWIGPW